MRLTPTCSVSGSGSSVSVTTKLGMNALDGTSYRAVGTEQGQTDDTGAFGATIAQNFVFTSGGGYFASGSTGHLQRYYGTMQLVGSDAELIQLTFRITANGSPSLAVGENRCMVEATATPAS